MTALELAAELEVSVRTVYRDVLDLGAAGVPIFGEKGWGGGFRLLDGYRTNLTGLTEDEAATLLLAGAPGPAGQLGLGSLLASTRLKLLAAVPSSLREVAIRAEQRFHLDPTGWVHAAPRDERHLQAIASAVWTDRQLRVRYGRDPHRAAWRLISPLGLVHKTGTWYLLAIADGETRTYRIDRVRDAILTESPVERPSGFDLAAAWTTLEADYAASVPTFLAEVWMGPIAERYRGSLGGLSPRAALELGRGADGRMRARLTFDDRRGAVAALLALSPDVEVIEPAELRAELREVAGRAIDRNRVD
jgi:predicted DNA-binding transcriptional regulator YafY